MHNKTARSLLCSVENVKQHSPIGQVVGWGTVGGQVCPLLSSYHQRPEYS